MKKPSRFIQDSQGKMRGRIGEGKDNVPTAHQDWDGAHPSKLSHLLSRLFTGTSTNWENFVEGRLSQTATMAGTDNIMRLANESSAKETLETAIALGAEINAISGSIIYGTRIYKTHMWDDEALDYENLGFHASVEDAENALATWVMGNWDRGMGGAYAPWSADWVHGDERDSVWKEKAEKFAREHSSKEILDIYFNVHNRLDEYILKDHMADMYNFHDKYEFKKYLIAPKSVSPDRWTANVSK